MGPCVENTRNQCFFMWCQVRRLQSEGNHRYTQFKHDLNKKEREATKLKERLNLLLSDKCQEKKIGDPSCSFLRSFQVVLSLLTGFPQRLENLENESGHGKVMEHEKLAKKIREFCAQSWNFTSEFYQICALFADIRKFSIDLEKSAFSGLFCQMSRMKTLSRKKVMENCETVTENSWKKYLHSLWEP